MAKEKTSVTLRRTAGEVKRYRQYRKFIPIIIALLLLILIIGYVLSVLYMRFGAFTVMVNKFDNLDYALTLSDTQTFKTNTSRLNADIFEKITNISVNWLPEGLDNMDGEHNGNNYIAYTFYAKNEGRSTFSYTYDLYIANMTLEIEKAVRVRLYINGKYVDYAYPRTDGGEGPEPGTTAFMSRTTIVKDTIHDLAPGEYTKFTIVMWLEGDDPECVDKILGGEMKIDMKLEVLRDSTSDNEKA